MELFAVTSVMSMLIATQQIDTTTSKMVRMKKHACGVHNEALLSRICRLRISLATCGLHDSHSLRSHTFSLIRRAVIPLSR